MKTLILTVSTGQGHNSTANAVQTVFTANGCECKKIDIGYEANKLLGFILDKGYLFSVNHLKKLYSKTYTGLMDREAGTEDITTKTARRISKKLRSRILSYAPDIIVCTHVFAAMVIKPYILSKEVHAKTFGIVTDYTIHPYWEEATALDYIVIPSEELSGDCIKKGYKESQILALGVPLQQKFSAVLSKDAAREQLGLLPELPVISVMSGSMCFGGLTNTIKALDKLERDFQLIAVCGSAEKELKKLQKENFRHNILKLGFTDKMNIIMDASDCIITKPGGLSTSEALSRKLPMILTKAIPGHEERNLSFFVNNGAALAVTDNETVDILLQRYFDDDTLRKSMHESAEKLSKFQAAENLYKFAAQ